MKYGNRIAKKPVVISEDGSTVKLNRVPFTQKDFDEMWLQELLRKTPNILPVSEIEHIFSPLISIGREVNTKVGPVDNLFISPDGYLTIVETKLWRNPEARRKVVGQIIDYAQDFTNWTYEDLNNNVKEYNRKYNGTNEGLAETIIKHDDSQKHDISSLVDNIYRNMKRGRFLLLIVGDGIRESVEDMVNFLNKYPTLSFTLGFIELQVYDFKKDNSKLVIPHVISRTKIIERTIVEVKGTDIKSINVDIFENKKTNKNKRTKLNEVKFYKNLQKEQGQEMVDFIKLLFEDMEDLNCNVDWKSSNIMIKFPIADQDYTLFGISKEQSIFVGWLHSQLKNNGFNKELGYNYYKEIAKIFDNIEVNKKKDSLTRNIHLKELKENYNQFLEVVQTFINRLENNNVD